ncbi:hypothetical protein MMC25_002559 [Agyrium rufum]|nr:hypothetical protein [Agyrium rufum]
MGDPAEDLYQKKIRQHEANWKEPSQERSPRKISSQHRLFRELRELRGLHARFTVPAVDHDLSWRLSDDSDFTISSPERSADSNRSTPPPSDLSKISQQEYLVHLITACIRDWAFRSAGLPSPWTAHDEWFQFTREIEFWARTLTNGKITKAFALEYYKLKCQFTRDDKPCAPSLESTAFADSLRTFTTRNGLDASSASSSGPIDNRVRAFMLRHNLVDSSASSSGSNLRDDWLDLLVNSDSGRRNRPNEPSIRTQNRKRTSRIIQLLDLRTMLAKGRHGDGSIEALEKELKSTCWPGACLSYEICARIADYLPRQTVLNLRLTSKELYRQFSEPAFRAVVVPFREEIYNTAQSKTLNKGADIPVSTIKTGVENALDVFTGWGPYIQKFALAYDFDDSKLECLPAKVKGLQLVESWWGSYYWPTEERPRYEDISKSIQRAEETSLLTEALSRLSEVNELGLSLLSGRGWLEGPDKSIRVKTLHPRKSEVFGRRYPAAEPAEMKSILAWEAKLSENEECLRELMNGETVDKAILLRYAELLSLSAFPLDAALAFVASFMKANPEGHLSGIDPTAVNWEHLAVLKCLRGNLETGSDPTLRYPEFDNLPKMVNLAARVKDSSEFKSLPLQATDGAHQASWFWSEWFNSAFTQPSSLSQASMENFKINIQYNSRLSQYRPRPEALRIGSALTTSKLSQHIYLETFRRELMMRNQTKGRRSDMAVIPAQLKPLQVEYLLELSWAQIAFLSSYIVAIINNPGNLMNNVHTLNLACISSSYLDMLDREDLWDALANVKTVKIMVSPDWREMKKNEDSIEEVKLNPSLAVSQLTSIICNHIAKRPSITDLQVGYTHGGEKATGILARNQLILPAPIFDQSGRSLVELPYLRRLTLRNCWASPAALVRFVNQLHASYNFVDLTLDSFSVLVEEGLWQEAGTKPRYAPLDSNYTDFRIVLPRAQSYGVACLPQAKQADSAILDAVSQTPVNRDATQHARYRTLYGYRRIMPPQSQLLASADMSHPWLLPGAILWTWPHILDAITPALTLGEQRFRRGFFDPRQVSSGGTPRARHMRRITFSSCGYVRLRHQRYHAPSGDRKAVPGELSEVFADRLVTLTPHMLDPVNDPWVANVVMHISPEEGDLLSRGFGMRVGRLGADRERGAERKRDGEVWDESVESWEAGEPLEDWMMEAGTGRFWGAVAE